MQREPKEGGKKKKKNSAHLLVERGGSENENRGSRHMKRRSKSGLAILKTVNGRRVSERRKENH